MKSVPLVMKRHLSRAKVSAFRPRTDAKQSLSMASAREYCVEGTEHEQDRNRCQFSSKCATTWTYSVVSLNIYLESGSQSSCVSSVDNSVSVELAECAWLGVGGKVVLSNRRHVQRRSKRDWDEVAMETNKWSKQNVGYYKAGIINIDTGFDEWEYYFLPSCGCVPSHPLAHPFDWAPVTPDPLPHKLCCWRASSRTVRQYVINITASGI